MSAKNGHEDPAFTRREPPAPAEAAPRRRTWRVLPDLRVAGVPLFGIEWLATGGGLG